MHRLKRNLGSFAAVFLLVALGKNRAHAQTIRVDGENPADREIQAEAPDRPKDMPLSLLPEPRASEPRQPRPEALEAIDQLLKDIISPERSVRASAELLILRAKTDWVSGIERRVNRLAERSDRPAMKRLFESILDTTKSMPPSGRPPDYLKDVLALPQPENQVWRDLTQLLATNRMLTAVGTADAARVIVFIYSRFGEFMRIDCQRQLEALGERSTAALIDARRHPAPKIATWAERLLSLSHKLDPQEAVRTDDSQALAEILVALGRSRDPELTNLLLSFAASDRAAVKQAAREGLVYLGDVGSWQLKDAYKDITGKTPPRDWTWKRTARELFTEYDRLQLEEAYALFNAGQSALAAKDYDKMLQAYDKIVAKVPAFHQKQQLAQGYMSAAQALRQSDTKQALSAAFRAQQLFDSPAEKSQAEGLRRLLEAETLREQGWIDQVQLKRARTLDPALAPGVAKLDERSTVVPSWGVTSRYAVALAVALLSLGGAAWIIFTVWLRREKKID